MKHRQTFGVSSPLKLKTIKGAAWKISTSLPQSTIGNWYWKAKTSWSAADRMLYAILHSEDCLSTTATSAWLERPVLAWITRQPNICTCQLKLPAQVQFSCQPGEHHTVVSWNLLLSSATCICCAELGAAYTLSKRLGCIVCTPNYGAKIDETFSTQPLQLLGPANCQL